jgi:hypothetical protein
MDGSTVVEKIPAGSDKGCLRGPEVKTKREEPAYAKTVNIN